MTRLDKFEDLNRWFISLGTGMTQPNKFEDLNSQIDRSSPQTCPSTSSQSINLLHCVIPVPKLENQMFMSSNLFNHVIPIPKFDFESHMGQNKAI